MAPIDSKGMIDETKFFHGVALHGPLLVQHAPSDLTSKDNSHALILRRGLWSAWVFTCLARIPKVVFWRIIPSVYI